MNKGKMSYLRSKSFNKRSRRKNKTKSIRRREKGSKLGESLEKMRLKRRKGSENSLQRKRGPINWLLKMRENRMNWPRREQMSGLPERTRSRMLWAKWRTLCSRRAMLPRKSRRRGSFSMLWKKIRERSSVRRIRRWQRGREILRSRRPLISRSRKRMIKGKRKWSKIRSIYKWSSIKTKWTRSIRRRGKSVICRRGKSTSNSRGCRWVNFHLLKTSPR